MGGMMVVLKTLLFVTVTLNLSSAASHSLRYFYTAVTPGINFPEYTAVGMVDGEQFMYYDSNIRKMIPKTEWIKKITAEDSEYWDSETTISQNWQESFKVNVARLMQRFNQTKGVHTVQVMYGCELDFKGAEEGVNAEGATDDGTKRGYELYGYDGEDFFSLDLNTLTWVAPVSQAVITKQKWEKEGRAAQDMNYLMNFCIDWLQKYVGYGRSTLERKVSPEVSLFQRDFSSPVVCHATGFFPRAVMISWQKNGEDVYGDVDLRETLPNNDGTFQKRSVLTVSPEDLEKHQYTCVVQHTSLEKEMVLQVSNRRILSKGESGGGSVGVIVIVGVVVALLLVVVAGVGFFIWKKSIRGFKRVPGSSSSSTKGDQDSLSSVSTANKLIK